MKSSLTPRAHCPFCHVDDSLIKAVQGSVFAIEDQSPVSEGHHLIIPCRHCQTYFDMTDTERRDAARLIDRLKEEIQEKDCGVTGFNLGVNCGQDAGQTVFHTHIHLIPRRPGDTPRPRGGVRGVIPDKMNY